VRPQARVRDYLIEERNVPGEILDKYLIGETGDNIVFPFMRDGELIMCKVREAVDGAKPKPTEADCEKILFGWQAIDDDQRDLYITEGEIDSLSLAAYGYAAVSVPFGGGAGNKQDWIENEYDRLQRFETVYLCLDDDEAGREAVEEIAKRLGRHRCRVVTLPRKDANECLMDGVSREEIAGAVEQASTMDPETISRTLDYGENVISLFYPADGRPVGATMPYLNLRDKILFRPGEVTVWTGHTGSGKSQILSDCMVSWISDGDKCVLASLEMAPAQSLKRMVKQVTGIGGEARPTEKSINGVMDWLDGGLLIYNTVGKETVPNMLEAFAYCRHKYGSDTFVIDSLMRCGIAQDDYNAQEAAVYQIVNFAIENDIHVHLVAHARKAGKDEHGPPDVESVKGAMEITANAFNVISIWRDRVTEDAVASADGDENKLTEAQIAKRDAGLVHINVAKQRNGDWTGKKRLHFLDCYQYRSNGDGELRKYVMDIKHDEAV
jgi:twinkle protein